MHTVIHEVFEDGATLLTAEIASQTRLLWLPAHEWSEHPEDWEDAKVGLASGVDEIDVTLINPAGGRNGLPVVSRKAFHQDMVAPSWLSQPRLLVITELTKALIRGKIGSVPAVMPRAVYEEFFEGTTLSPALTDHAAIGPGDTLGGIVTDINARAGGVQLDPVQYLQGLELQIHNEFSDHPQSALARGRPEPSVPPRMSPAVAGRIRAVLLLENSDSVRTSLLRCLHRWHLNAVACSSLNEARQCLAAALFRRSASDSDTAPESFYLAIVDPNLNPENDDLSGMDIVQALSTDSQWRILVFTGEACDERKSRQYGDIPVHGFEHKPFTSDRLLESIECCLAVDRPRPLRQWVLDELAEPNGATQPSPSSVPRLPHNTVASANRPTVSSLLQTLANLRPGAVIHLFAIHQRSLRARSIANVGTALQWYPFRGKIPKSRIKDTAWADGPIVELESSNAPLHFWTRQMMAYSAFCGVPISVPGPYRHALVAFHGNARNFDAAWVCAARLCSEQIARLLETSQLMAGRQREATLAASGLAMECVAHELCNDLTDLHLELDEIHRLLIAPPVSGRSPHAEAVKEILTYRDELQDSLEKVTLLLGVRAPKSPVNLRATIRQAGISCRRVASETLGADARRYVRIDLLEADPGSRYYVRAVPASLLVVFFNLYINAVQQMRLMSDIRDQGRVWPTLRTLSVSGVPRWAIVQIHDTGPGIHHDDWERLFVAGYSTKPNGTGLGLYICRHLLADISYEGRRGSIQVSRSVLWSGTTMTVRLPLMLAESTCRSDGDEQEDSAIG